MLYSSTNLYPDGVSIDATENNDFTWTVNADGGSAQTHYQLVIYLNSSNASVYDSTKTASATASCTVPSGTLTNNNIYKCRVTVWSGVSYTTSYWALFYTNTNATLTLGALPTNQQSFEFTCTYNQAQDIPIKTYKVDLYLSSDLTTPLLTSGEVYPATLMGNGDIIEYTFDGMQSGIEYGVEFTVVTQNDYTVSTGINTFTVTYLYPPAIPTLSLTPDDTLGIITLDWIGLVQKLGYVIGTSSYVAGKFDLGLQLDANSVLYYTETIPIDYTLYFWVKIPNGYDGTLVEFSNNNGTGLQIFYKNNKFGYIHDNYRTIGRTTSGVVTVWTFIGVKHRQLFIKNATYEETISF